jgi:gliding motility-associated-like protein
MHAQNVAPQVINSAGQHYATPVNGIYFSDNIGEPFAKTQTSNSLIVTEGFLQPFVISANIFGDVQTSNVSCLGKNDGALSVSVTCNIPNRTIKYCWTPLSVCPDSSCASIDSLKPGSYFVRVRVTYTLGGVIKTDSSIVQNFLIQDLKIPCQVKIFNAVTLNGDGINDTWQIDNISEFPDNEVKIFNRWGEKVFDTKKYDNLKNSWPEKDNNKLLSSTYFYIIDLGDGSPLIKGWIELLKN